MRLFLSENIRIYRKKMSLTQEQLAEAMGTSSATVSKWENGIICPDIEMLAELAAFFQTSVDVLIGYEWKKQSEGQSIDLIQKLCNERKYEEAEAEARKAIQKYPNSFQVMYISGVTLFAWALRDMVDTNGKCEPNKKEEMEYAIKILQQALALFEQNTDHKISKESIYQKIANLYGEMGEKEKAIEYLEKYNICNMNDRMIGLYLCQTKKYDRAWNYAIEAFRKSLIDVWLNYEGIYHVLLETQHYQKAIEISTWTKEFCMSVSSENGSYFERAAVVVDTMIAKIYAYREASEKQDYQTEMRTHLRTALLEAKHFDNYPDYMGKTKFFEYEYELEPLFDNIGENSISFIKYFIEESKLNGEPYRNMVKVYNELLQELGFDREYMILEEI